ncbi:MAG TPA: MotA/TolQ/ExbB proton channel family protein [Gemmatimonadaceae bacterium]|nr:MotA/TolQ/ExbB proton channel family protein [Gemmatimonadaceae bacterium]
MSILLEYYRSGGPVMHVILVLAVLGLGVFLERAWVIITNSKGSDRAFIEKVVVLARAGKTDEAVRLCHSHKTAMTYIGELVLRSPSRSESDLQNAADAASVASLPTLTRRLHYLPMLANVATLCGLLGTIFGLREAFGSVALVSAAERSGKLASGIAIALNATGFGLMVAIPLSLAHAWLTSRAERLIERADEFSVRLITALSTKASEGRES